MRKPVPGAAILNSSGLVADKGGADVELAPKVEAGSVLKRCVSLLSFWEEASHFY